MNFSRKLNLNLFFGLLLFSSMFLMVQSAYSTSTLAGTIYDKGRNPLSEIEVELLNDYYQSIRRSRTDGTGRYQFDRLPDGRYSVRVFAFRYDFEDQTQEQEINTQNIRGGEGSGYFLLDFYLSPKKGGLAEAELAVIFAQSIPPEAKLLYEKGMDFLSKKKTAEGITALNDAVQLFPEYYLALHRVGQELFKQKRYAEAFPFLLKAIDVNPKSATSLYYLGSSLFRMGPEYHKAAMSSLIQANVIAPASVQILWALARVERAAGKFAEAETHLLHAKKVSGGGIAEIHEELAKLYSEDLKKYDLAADELELFLKASKMKDEDEKKFRAIISGFRVKAKAQSGN